jgi:cation:H+ antiporter
MAMELDHLPFPALAAFFALAATVVWFAGARLTHIADELSDRWHLSKSLVGLLLLSTATSLPEIATTLSAAVRQAQSLVLSNLYGGIALQTSMLALADLWARGSITNYPRRMNHALEAALLILLLTLSAAVIAFGEPFEIAEIGLGSILVAVGYVAVIWFLRRHDPEHDWLPVEFPEELEAEMEVTARHGIAVGDRALVLQGCLASASIFIFGLSLVLLAEEFALRTGLATGFIGVTLLAGATSLPELTTTIAAVRAGAYTLAISNIFGSNLIMLVLVFPADVLFREGPLLADTGPLPPLALLAGSLVTGVYLIGLIVRHKPRVGRVGVDSLVVMLIFLLSLAAYYVKA